MRHTTVRMRFLGGVHIASVADVQERMRKLINA